MRAIFRWAFGTNIECEREADYRYQTNMASIQRMEDSVKRLSALKPAADLDGAIKQITRRQDA